MSKEMEMPKPIEVTEDGRAILARYQSQRSKHLQVVLCFWNAEFVTWIFNISSGGYGHGHYFTCAIFPYTEEDKKHGYDEAYKKAVDDFCERIKKEL